MQQQQLALFRQAIYLILLLYVSSLEAAGVLRNATLHDNDLMSVSRFSHGWRQVAHYGAIGGEHAYNHHAGGWVEVDLPEGVAALYYVGVPELRGAQYLVCFDCDQQYGFERIVELSDDSAESRILFSIKDINPSVPHRVRITNRRGASRGRGRGISLDALILTLQMDDSETMASTSSRLLAGTEEFNHLGYHLLDDNDMEPSEGNMGMEGFEEIPIIWGGKEFQGSSLQLLPTAENLESFLSGEGDVVSTESSSPLSTFSVPLPTPSVPLPTPIDDSQTPFRRPLSVKQNNVAASTTPIPADVSTTTYTVAIGPFTVEIPWPIISQSAVPTTIPSTSTLSAPTSSQSSLASASGASTIQSVSSTFTISIPAGSTTEVPTGITTISTSAGNTSPSDSQTPSLSATAPSVTFTFRTTTDVTTTPSTAPTLPVTTSSSSVPVSSSIEPVSTQTSSLSSIFPTSGTTTSVSQSQSQSLGSTLSVSSLSTSFSSSVSIVSPSTTGIESRTTSAFSSSSSQLSQTIGTTSSQSSSSSFSAIPSSTVSITSSISSSIPQSSSFSSAVQNSTSSTISSTSTSSSSTTQSNSGTSTAPTASASSGNDSNKEDSDGTRVLTITSFYPTSTDGTSAGSQLGASQSLSTSLVALVAVLASLAFLSIFLAVFMVVRNSRRRAKRSSTLQRNASVITPFPYPPRNMPSPSPPPPPPGSGGDPLSRNSYTTKYFGASVVPRPNESGSNWYGNYGQPGPSMHSWGDPVSINPSPPPLPRSATSPPARPLRSPLRESAYPYGSPSAWTHSPYSPPSPSIYGDR
ncbi:hypothetical protein QCA50_001673 [Cerrena zonata]|uniref:Uncharacterized protein n=1 Tax=Cerrena zonata TaxID=2478898 RepID=A0AAW0GRH2_9APHY